ncbi:MAG: hypothetical protein WD267_05020 [Balneolales bacterium]
MRIPKVLPAALPMLIFLLTIVGCGTTEDQVERGRNTYHFEYEDQTYRIISLTDPENNGSNYLVLSQEGQVKLRARDNDQNGVLDTLLLGEISLDKANEIYTTGISLAIADHKFEERTPSRVFEYIVNDTIYIVQTIMQDSPYNRFIIYDQKNGDEHIILIDNEANGILDEKENGDMDFKSYQELYSIVLKAGLTEGRVRNEEGRYIIVRD